MNKHHAVSANFISSNQDITYDLNLLSRKLDRNHYRYWDLVSVTVTISKEQVSIQDVSKWFFFCKIA